MGVCMSSRREKESEQSRMGKEVLNAEAKAGQLLAEMPGRLCSNGGTKTCSLYTQEGWKGINQDSMLVWEGFAAEEKSVFLGVFDGHGPNGHMVARKVRDCLPSLLTLPLESLLEGSDTPHHHIYKPIKITDASNCSNTQSSKLTDWMRDFADVDHASTGVRERFTAAFHKMDERLKVHPKISCTSSGTTAVAILVQGEDLVVGSVGDSRAILLTRSVDRMVANQLTVELKPDSPGEIERILKCEGRVFALDDEPHIQRLWLPHASTPGLAMARALGDFCLKQHGLIATPQICHRKLSEEDECIILATDGVWDVLTNTEVVEAICSSASKEAAAMAIVESATSVWKRRNLEHRIDDCTAVCYFLKQKKPDLSSNLEVSDMKANVQQDQAGSPDPQQNNQALARYDTLVAEDLADKLDALEVNQKEEDAATHKSSSSAEEAENHPQLPRHGTLTTAKLAELELS